MTTPTGTGGPSILLAGRSLGVIADLVRKGEVLAVVVVTLHMEGVFRTIPEIPLPELNLG
jgi:hypothetical protein